jgi:hypothetical protein
VTSPVTPAVTPTAPNGAIQQHGKHNNIKDDITVVQATNERRLGAADVAAYGAAIGLGRYVAASLLGPVLS